MGGDGIASELGGGCEEEREKGSLRGSAAMGFVGVCGVLRSGVRRAAVERSATAAAAAVTVAAARAKAPRTIRAMSATMGSPEDDSVMRTVERKITAALEPVKIDVIPAYGDPNGSHVRCVALRIVVLLCGDTLQALQPALCARSFTRAHCDVSPVWRTRALTTI
mmetsp:Transcript_1015/g.2925  ORF Transcript_1015/g.2925 Transcript_1015/m.2925 type:complete len:165 (-) Transcript_1015:660-1154(-)